MMDGDRVARFRHELHTELADPQDVVTLLAMQEALGLHVAAVEFERLLAEFAAQGWVKNAPGLVCHQCGAPTWGKEEGAVELVRCSDPVCRTVKRVVVK